MLGVYTSVHHGSPKDEIRFRVCPRDSPINASKRLICAAMSAVDPQVFFQQATQM